MANQNTVYIVVNCNGAADRIRELIDKGFFSEANKITENLKSLTEKLQSTIQSKGGHLYLCLYERQVMEVPVSLAEEMPSILSPLFEIFGKEKVGVGMGFDFQEATKASQKSLITNQIELFEDSHPEVTPITYTKSELELPPNLFDDKMQEFEEPAKKIQDAKSKKVAIRPDVQQNLQAEAQYIAGMIQTLGGMSQEQMQQQMQQMQAQAQQAQQAQQGGGSLLSALNGGQLPPEAQQEAENPNEQPEQPASSDEPKEPQEDKADIHQKLGSVLASLKNQLPALMELANTNPEAFKQTMNLVNKLTHMAKNRKQVSKNENELIIECEDLVKMFNNKIHHKYPVGTRKGRRIKVQDPATGKTSWRSVAAGQLKDARGMDISVKSHNAKAKGTQDPMDKSDDLE